MSIHWKNEDNAYFYNSISENLLPSFAVRGGLDTGCDIDIVKKYIKKAHSILEVGAGYGRVIKYLIGKNCQAKITAIERSLRFCKLLELHFDKNIKIVHADIQHYETNETFDLILWMWSGICDFSKEEQFLVLKKLVGFLNKGLIILDTMPESLQPLNATSSKSQIDQNCTIPGGNDSYLHVYTPSAEEIYNYAKKLELGFVRRVPYVTTTNRDRVLYILGFTPP